MSSYFIIGLSFYECQECEAKMWYQKRTEKYKHSLIPKFQLCCGNGKVTIPLLKYPPQFLQHLLFNNEQIDSKNYQCNQGCSWVQVYISLYNAMFAFTSLDFKID